MVIFFELYNNIFFLFTQVHCYCYTIVEYYKISITEVSIRIYFIMYIFYIFNFNLVINFWNICFIMYNAIGI